GEELHRAARVVFFNEIDAGAFANVIEPFSLGLAGQDAKILKPAGIDLAQADGMGEVADRDAARFELELQLPAQSDMDSDDPGHDPAPHRPQIPGIGALSVPLSQSQPAVTFLTPIRPGAGGRT